MSFYNPNDGDTSRAYELSLANQGKGAVTIYNEMVFGATAPTTGDVIDLFYNKTLSGFYVLDWWVWMEQVDTNATPTVAFNIGMSSDGTSISGTAGLRWESNVTTLGRTSLPSRHRASTGNCLLSSGHAGRVGLQLTVAPATPAWNGKKVGMGIILAPAGSF